MSALTFPTLGPLGLCLVSACIGCGGDDTTEPPPQCAVEVVLTGGYEVSATGTSCNGSGQPGAAFTMGIDIPDASAASVRLRLFGVQLGSGAKGMSFPAGVLLSNPPTESWQAGMDDGSACTAVVDDDFEERPGESNLRVLKAHVESCSKTLLSEQPGHDPVTVVRLRGAARYVPQ